MVTWSQQPPETAGRSCAGTEQRWEEAGSGRAALPRHRHQHPASHPRCRRLGSVLGARRGSSCPGQDGPGQLLLRLQVGSPWGSGRGGLGRVPQQLPSSFPPLSALQGGSHRCRGGAEHGRAAEPGPQEEREAPSPPPGGAGHRQVAVRPPEPSCLSPSPGPGPRAGTAWHQPQAPAPWCWMPLCPSQGQVGDRALPGGTPRRPPPALCLPLLSADVAAPPCAHSSAWPWTSCGC